MDLTHVKTPTGKTVADFDIPIKLKEGYPKIVQLILETTAMNDAERKYWFKLSRVMKDAQLSKLKDILEQDLLLKESSRSDMHSDRSNREQWVIILLATALVAALMMLFYCNFYM